MATPEGVRISQAQEALSHLPGATCTFPFGDEVAVWKVGGRIIALVPEPASQSPLAGFVQVKADPAVVAHLVATHPAVHPAYYMSRVHWLRFSAIDDRPGSRAVTQISATPADLAEELIDGSWLAVVAGLPRAVRLPLLEEWEAQPT
jgi:predicted DNA-binding protein (MmcQ/YjbR family)